MTTSLQLDRTQRFYKYLKEFTLLKFKPQRTNEDATLIWLHSLPNEPEIFNPIYAEPDRIGETWLSIRRPSRQPVPTLPPLLADWVTGDLRKVDAVPVIQTQRVVEETVLDDDLQPQLIRSTLFLDEQPEVLAAWEAFESQWREWAAGERRALSVHDRYVQLFDLHQRLQAEGERFELRLGFGALRWRPEGAYAVDRHLITAQVHLQFDPVQGVLSVVPSADGARALLEQDMLDPQHRVRAGSAEEILAEYQEDVWDPAGVPAVLNAWANSASGEGEFIPDLRPPGAATVNPVVHWAPALILRKRGERTLAATYDSVIEQLEQAGMPDAAQRFMGEHDLVPPMENPAGGPRTVYFPLPSNDAQRSIVDRIGRARGVLVQGPPGTGKSHTIVNLVSHLLATNQRVLVTSHTERALKVLRDKFPPELAALCVTHLRGDSDARTMLERSVGEMIRRKEHRDAAAEVRQEQELEKRLEGLRQRESDLLDQLEALRLSETGSLDLHGYGGTPQQISEQLRAYEPRFEWVLEFNPSGAAAPLPDGDAGRLLERLRDVREEEAISLRLRRPDLGRLPSPEDFVQFARAEQQAQEAAAARSEGRDAPAFTPLTEAGATRREALLRALQDLQSQAVTARRRPSTWLPRAVDALLKGQWARWQDLATRTQDLLPVLQKEAEWMEANVIAGHGGRAPEQLEADAREVIKHLQAGGKWGGLFGKPAAVRERMYFKDALSVGGRAADNSDVVQDLLRLLQLEKKWTELKDLWAAQGVSTDGPRRLQLAELAEQLTLLTGLSSIQGALDRARQALGGIPGLGEPQWWNENELNELVTALRAADTEHAARVSREALEQTLPYLEGLRAAGSVHAVVQDLIGSLEGRDAPAYGSAYLHLTDLDRRAAALHDQEALLSRLQQGAPLLAAALLDDLDSAVWEERFSNLEAAWRWAHADTQLREITRPEAEQDVRAALRDVRQQERETLGQLAAVKAWRNTLDRLTQGQQANLVAWQQAVRRVGKGTGKHAGKFMAVARQSLTQARDSIPAWIMPMHLVAESFAPSRGMFDVVIVDEASQSGPEALFLTYIAKKLIVVGDDKQISPDGVGISAEQVDTLVRKYLHDFPATHVIGTPQSSLYDFTKYAYPGVLALREHFRCMPEIIKFSSDLSYAGEPLIALRQFGADRLQPLIAQHVPDGFTTGADRNVNPAEARAIVDQIKACVANPTYRGKTMGVISLLGDKQAEHINALLQRELSEAEIDARRIVCGNAYSFQGDERDVIFLSMVAAPSEGRARTVTMDDRIFQPRYNVAISRARDQLWLFHSVTPDDLGAEDLRATLIRHVQHPELAGWRPLPRQEILDLRELAGRTGRGQTRAPDPFDSWFEVDVYLQLVDRGYRVIPQYELNGYRIDLVVEGLRGRLAVECDGDQWHGPERYRADLARQQTLERAGMEFWRVRGSTFTRDPDAALADLWTKLDRRGVYPEGDPRNYAPSPDHTPDTSAPEGQPSPEVSPEAARRAESAAHEPIEQTASEVIDPATPDTATGTEPRTATTAPAATGPDAPTPSVIPSSSILEPYTVWASHPLTDPRSVDTFTPVIAGLRDIIAAEGPMPCRRAYQLYCQAANITLPVGKSLLNKAMSRALKDGTLLLERERGTGGYMDEIVRTPDTPTVRLRTVGPRKLADIPPSELQALMQHFVQREPSLAQGEREALFRLVLRAYGFKYLTENARAALGHAWLRLHSEATPQH
ncbi:AAA domain-containing protein [Deinococcus knuensis]|uniref:Very short patch repair endonuclease n=1 Tax=Deinococcus knuensis TaxID=1837380 RepID=A0ABQ2SDK4_9DEIO|nr:AAA domain-containing protein [Deinococcus knuensis]GGS15597.1 very short patch repair endonuclease [Deinococcus knuensis]